MALFLNNMRIFHILSDTFVSNMFPEKGDEISLLIASDELLDKAIHADELSQYDLGPVLSYNIKAYEDVKAFIHLWREEVMR